MSSVVILTDATFDDELKKATTPVLVDFWAPWCGPCKALAPVLEELAEEYAGRLVVAKVNIDENMTTPAKFGVRSIPNMVIFRGEEEISRIVGVRSKTDLKATIDPLL